MTGINNTEKGILSENILTVPNLLTCIRIILIVPFMIMFYWGNYTASLAVLIISGITDFLDGFIARIFAQTSQLGKYLDPLADKLTLFAVSVCVAVMFPGLVPVVIILIIKDILMIAGSLLLLKKSIYPPSARWFGKLATAAFYISAASCVPVYYLGEGVLWIAYLMFSVTFVLMIMAMIGYYKIFKTLLNLS